MLIPMKKVTLIALKENKEDLLLALQRCGEFMVIDTQEGEPEENVITQTDEKVKKAEALLGFTRKFREKKPLFEERPTINYDHFIKGDAEAKALIDKIEIIQTDLADCESDIQVFENQNAQLEPWKTMDLPIEKIKSTSNVQVFTGYLPEKEATDILETLNEYTCEIFKFGQNDEGQACLITVYHSESGELLNDIKNKGFIEATPPNVKGKAQAVIQENHKALAALREKREHLSAEMQVLAKEYDKIEVLTDYYSKISEREQVAMTETIETVIIDGWVRSDRLEVIKKAVTQVTDCYDLSMRDPLEDEQPPTVTKNNAFIHNFETITDMYSKPKPGSLDPAIFAGIWYWLIFGMMVGDVGYGTCMVIAIFIYKKLAKPRGSFLQLVNVLFYSGFTTIFWGIIFGSYFGETWNPILFSTLENPMGMLIFTMIVGLLHMFCGMGLKMAESIRTGHMLDAIFDQLSWMILLVGLGLLFLPQTASIGKYMAIAGAAVVLLTAGRKSKGVVGKILGGLLGLYGITSYMSDILSYSRILALALATSVIGMVMNLLAGMVAVNPIGYVFAILIYLAGHSFNLAISMLSAYVHDSRLEYIEFFNKFYEGGGYAFTPLSMNGKYTDVIDSVKSR